MGMTNRQRRKRARRRPPTDSGEAEMRQWARLYADVFHRARTCRKKDPNAPKRKGFLGGLSNTRRPTLARAAWNAGWAAGAPRGRRTR